MLHISSPTFHLGDILANAITHGIGAGLAIAGAAYLIVASTRGSARDIVSCSIFSATLILVYLCSTLYHSLVRTRARHVFHVLDHSSIYLLIAGTYTPFTLVSLRGPLGWIALRRGVGAGPRRGRLQKASPWTASRAVGWPSPPRWSISFRAGYWSSWRARCSMPSAGTAMAWLGAGGLAYTLGIVFFALDRLRYFHAAWHIFVLAGSIAHYFAILFYVVPPRG